MIFAFVKSNPNYDIEGNKKKKIKILYINMYTYNNKKYFFNKI